MMYNSTAHSTTGKSSSEWFFNRQCRDKIPSVVDVENRRIDLDVYDKDKLRRKRRRKLIEDRKRKAVDNEIKTGEKVR